MSYRAISRIFFGLLLLFFNINVYHLNLLTTFAGALLVMTGAWQLVPVNRHFRAAFGWSVVQVVLQAVGLVLLCLRWAEAQTAVLSAIISTINMMALMVALLSGLAEMAEAHGHTELAAKLRRGYKLYITGAIVIALALLFPPAVIIALPASVIIFIYILVQVNRLNRTVEAGTATAAERRAGPRYAAVLGGGVCLILVACVASLLLKSAPRVLTEIYNPHDRPGQTELQGIRDAMLKAGFDEGILKDLPDSEVLLYQNVLSVQNSQYTQSADGGTFELVKCVSSFGQGKLRIMFYYRWPEAPTHHYSDILMTQLPVGRFVLPNAYHYTGFSLYEQKTDQGYTTYKAAFIKDGTPSTFGSMPNSELVFRVFGGEAVRQRGFFAFDVMVASPGEETYYNTVVTCLHQRSVFNLGSGNVALSTGQGNPPLYSNESAYDRLQMIFEDAYKPEP